MEVNSTFYDLFELDMGDWWLNNVLIFLLHYYAHL